MVLPVSHIVSEVFSKKRKTEKSSEKILKDYPYGMQTDKSWRAEGYVDPGLLYQSAYASYDSLTGYYDFLFRSYDPALGRFFATDPLASATPSYSPYHVNANNPIMYTDPLGLSPRDTRFKDFGENRDQEKGDYNDWDFGLGGGMNSPFGTMNMELSQSNYGTLTPKWQQTSSSVTTAGIAGIVNGLLNTPFGGMWHSGTPDKVMLYGNGFTATFFASQYNNRHRSWGNTEAGSVKGAFDNLYMEHMIAQNPNVDHRYSMACRDCESIPTTGIGQTDPLMDQLNAHLDQYHIGTLLGLEHSPTFYIDRDGQFTSTKNPGHTSFKGTLPGASDIYIHPSAFEGQFKLFLVTGHELIHATQISDGSFKKWLGSYGLSGATNIAEFNAYKWQSHQESILRVNYGAVSQLAKYRNWLPAGYLNR